MLRTHQAIFSLELFPVKHSYFRANVFNIIIANEHIHGQHNAIFKERLSFWQMKIKIEAIKLMDSFTTPLD